MVGTAQLLVSQPLAQVFLAGAPALAGPRGAMGGDCPLLGNSFIGVYRVQTVYLDRSFPSQSPGHP